MSGPGAGLCKPAEPVAPPEERRTIDREQAEAIHAAIEHLPRVFRSAVVLCYFEGLTLDEAARRLRCPAGTLRSRLARAREKLRISLTRRGVVLPATVLGAVLAPRSASASIRPLLCDSTTRAAVQFAAGHAVGGAPSAPAAALAREVLRTMLLSKIKLTALSLLLLASVATSAGWAARALVSKDEPVSNPPATLVARAADPPAPVAKPADSTQGADVRHGPCARSAGKAHSERSSCCLRRAFVFSRRRLATPSTAGRSGARGGPLRRIGAVSHRHAAHLLVKVQTRRRRCDGAGLWLHLGCSRPRCCRAKR